MVQSDNSVIPLVNLHPHQALTLLNRWAKLKDYFYHADRNALYALKGKTIAGWLATGEVTATRLICRESPAISWMKEQVDTGGESLEHLHYMKWQSNIFSPALGHWQLLEQLVQSEEMNVPLPDLERARLAATYSSELLAYCEAIATNDANWLAFAPQLLAHKTYLCDRLITATKKIHTKERSVYLEAVKWLERDPTPNQLRRVKELIAKHQLDNLGLFSQFDSSNLPIKPQPPIMVAAISVAEYVAMNPPELVTALEWAASVLDLPTFLAIDISEELLYDELETAAIEEDLAQLRVLALDTFTAAIAQRLTPEDVYDRLIALNLDYSEVGIKYRQHRYGDMLPAKFSAWHEINFSLTGYWLVEYQSALFPEITWHSPYDRTLAVITQNLPQVVTTETKFGKEVSIAEQSRYPIAELLKILGTSIDKFPYKLRNYWLGNDRYLRNARLHDEEDLMAEDMFDDI